MKVSTGSVFILGAGPGDLEYLTLKALRLLQKADVVLIDSLVNPSIAEYLKVGTKVIYVGKRGGCPSTPQEQITQRMISLAREGLNVARVKGGDPVIFGRVGEEMAALAEAGIHVVVCNGISSGLAIPSSIGIPLTHRELAHGTIFVTGSNQDNTQPIAWEALVKSNLTIVVFMALANIEFIANNLIAAGMPVNTPAAAVQNGTLPEQKNVLAPLVKLAEKVRLACLSSPTLLIVGEVVQLSPLWPADNCHADDSVLAAHPPLQAPNRLHQQWRQ